MVDHRKDPSYLRPTDTIRGCVIDNIYEPTIEQLVEIMELSDAQAEQSAARR